MYFVPSLFLSQFALPCLIFCLQTLFIYLYGRDVAAVVILVAHVLRAGNQAMVGHMFLPHCVVTVVVVNHLHCFVLC